MPGVEGLKKLQYLGAAALAQHDPVGSHPQRLLEQGAKRDFAAAVGVGRAADQADEMGMKRTELGGVLKRDDALGVGDLTEQIVSQGGFAAAGCSRHDQ